VNSGALDDAYERLHRMGPEYEGDRDHTAVEACERTGDPDTLAAARHIIELTRR
jgi:hypothetical protein